MLHPRGRGTQEKEKQISAAAHLGDLRQGRDGRREGKRPFLTYSILSGWGMLHVRHLTHTSPSQALQEALPTGHRTCWYKPRPQKSPLLVWWGLRVGRKGTHSQAHLTCWFSGNIGRLFLFAFHLVTWYLDRGKVGRIREQTLGSPLASKGLRLCLRPDSLHLPRTFRSADKTEKGPAI